MVSKNNRIKRMEEVAGRQSHFGIRKLTIGAASVLLGITLLFGANAKVARADGTNVNTGAEGVAQETPSTSNVAVETTQSNESIDTGELGASGIAAQFYAQANVNALPKKGDDNKQPKPDWYMDDPSKATDEATAYKNLKSAIEYVRGEIKKNGSIKGLTVSGPYDSKPGDNARIPDELDKSKVGVIYDNENLSAEDMQKQANDIWQKISTYVAKRNEFIQGLKEQGIYKDGDVDPTTLAQHLILQSEPQARSEYKIQDNNGKWTTTDHNEVVTVKRDPHAPFVNDPNDPFVNPAYAVQLKNNNQVTGPIIQITYTNLENSEYDGKPLGKIVETFSDVHATDINDPKAAFYISTNPTNGWLYTHCDGVTVTIQLYDNQAQPIKIDSSAYVSVSSLNSNGLTATPDGKTSDIKGRTEAAQLLSKGSAMSIPESSVQVFPDNKVFSPSDNEDLLYNKTHNKDQINYWGKFFAPREADWNKVGNYVIKNYSDWDNTGSKKIFGSALYKVEENPIVIRSYVIRNSSNTIPGFWFTYSTTVPQTSFDAINTINYHFATAHATSTVLKTQDSTRRITYVNRQGNTEVFPHKDQKITFTGTATKDNSTGNIVKVGETGVITQVGDGKVDNINNYGNWTWKTNDGASGKGDSAEINDVISPIIKDMHVVNVSTDATKDGKNVDSTTLKRGNSYNVVVTYDKDQYAQIIYRDVNDPNNIIKLDKSPEVTGTAGDPITFGDKDNPTNKITDYENKGYVLVSDEFNSGKPIFDSNDGIQIFNIDFKHGTTPVTPDKPQKPDDPINSNDPNGPKWPDENEYRKTYTYTVHFVDKDGKQVAPDATQTAVWGRNLQIDKVTGQILNPNAGWTLRDPSKPNYNATKVPVVNGYVASKTSVNGQPVSSTLPGSVKKQQNTEDTVVYNKMGKIVPVDPNGNQIQNVPNPPYKNDQTDPTKVIPNEPVPDIPGKTPTQKTVTPEDPSQDTPVAYNPIPKVPGLSDNTPTPRHHKKHNGGESSTTRSRPTGYTPVPKGSGYLDANGKVHYKLPQTGESDSEEMVAFLGGVAAAIGLIGLAGAKKRRHE